MGWNELDNKLKRILDRNFVSCDERYELADIKKIIKEEFPWLSDYLVKTAIENCCQKVSPPRNRSDFLKCLKEELNA
jgi:hypothetical protein